MRVKNLYRLSQYNRRRHFTLVEIMVVIVIIAVILGITVPVFNSIATRKSVDAAASMIASAFRLARAEAAQRRVEVGIGIYIEDGTTHSGASFQAWWKNPDTGNPELFPNSRMEMLPAGALIEVPSGNFHTWYIIYYKPSGRPVYYTPAGVAVAPQTFTILEAVLDQSGTRRVLHGANTSEVRINQYTGNVTVTSVTAP